MEDNCWPKTIYQWTAHGMKRRGIPQQSWKNQVTDFVRDKNMEEDRHLWRLGVECIGCIDPNNNKIYIIQGSAVH